MKKLLKFAVLAFLLSFALQANAQQTLSEQFTETVQLAPAAVVVGQNFSTSTSTGAIASTTGGSVAAGSYRISVTCFSASNTETPQSTDTAATSVLTTTGATSTVTIYPPICAGANAVGWRMGVSNSGGATASETLQTITSTVCTLSTSGTASCALTSPAVFTSSANFSAGSGIGPSTPGTLITPPIANQANMALFENGNYPTQILSWVTTGTVPSACTINIQTGATVAALASVGQTITCTAATGSYALPSTARPIFVAPNLATYTAGDTTTSTTFYLTTLPYIQPIYWGPAAPTSACGATMGAFFLVSANSNLYTCVTTTWTAITLP